MNEKLQVLKTNRWTSTQAFRHSVCEESLRLKNKNVAYLFHLTMDQLVTVRSFMYSHEAQLARQTLESYDIHCFLKDELTIQTNPLYTHALGGVKLQVRSSDVKHALEILDANGLIDKPINQSLTITNETGTLESCPVYNNPEVSLVKGFSNRFISMFFLLLGIPAPYRKQYYHCYECGADITVKKGAK